MEVPVLFGSIMVVGVLTYCELLHSVCDLKAAQMIVQRSLIWELMLHELELGHNAVKAIKNICCATGKGAVDHITVIVVYIVEEEQQPNG